MCEMLCYQTNHTSDVKLPAGRSMDNALGGRSCSGCRTTAEAAPEKNKSEDKFLG